MKLALAIVAASTLVAATAMPAPRSSLSQARTISQARPISQQISVDPVSPSVAGLPVIEPPSADARPAAGSALPEDASPAREEEATPAAEPAPVAARRAPRVTVASLCAAPTSNPECQAMFAAALRPMLEPADVIVSASGSAEVIGPRGAQPLHFQKHAPWVRRLETIGKEGIPFVRIPRGPDREVVVGINRKGVLGFSLHERRNEN